VCSSDLNTTACVTQTVAGALLRGQRVVAVEDLLGDVNCEAERPLAPKDHAEYLAGCVKTRLLQCVQRLEQHRRDRHPRDYAGASNVSYIDVLPTVNAHMQRFKPLSAAEVLAAMPVRAEHRRRAVSSQAPLPV
jgi:hypothetical protein